MAVLDLMSLFATIVVLALAPGPAVLLIMVRAASSDVAGAIWFGTGVAVGGVLIVAAVCFGLSAWMTANPNLFDYTKYVMLAYLSWVAWCVWTGGFDLTAEAESSKDTGPAPCRSALLAGFVTCFLSPYYIIILPLMLPEVTDIKEIETSQFVILALTTFMALFVGGAIVAFFAAQLRRLARSARAMQIMNRSLAALLVTGGGWMALS